MDSIYHLRLSLKAIDDEIHPLVIRKQEIVKKIAKATERKAMRRLADVVADTINKISDIKNPTTSLHHTNTQLHPWRHSLPRKHFESTRNVWPESLPSNWTNEKASEFLASLTKALELDSAALEGAKADE
jgi:hypothetical protein